MRIFNVHLQSGKLDQRGARSNLDQKIEAAAFDVHTLCHRAKHAQVARAMGRGDCEDFLALLSHKFGRFHNGE